MRLSRALALLAAACAAVAALATPARAECEVCVAVVDKIRESMPKKERSKMEFWEEAIDGYCGTVDGWGSSKAMAADDKEKKLCYAFTPIKKEVARPAAMGMPSLKVCQRASKTDGTICEIKHPKPPPDLTKMTVEEIKKMRVRKLKDLLNEHKISYKGLVEKDEFVKLVLDKRQKALDKKEL
jgi:hypothetical protein|uniref:ARMET N-terminal domain-containing protein n=1 Tax=Prasinoderma singulare TaxID=676789 RepID=A0A7S3BB24_9VIRI